MEPTKTPFTMQECLQHAKSNEYWDKRTNGWKLATIKGTERCVKKSLESIGCTFSGWFHPEPKKLEYKFCKMLEQEQFNIQYDEKGNKTIFFGNNKYDKSGIDDSTIEHILSNMVLLKNKYIKTKQQIIDIAESNPGKAFKNIDKDLTSDKDFMLEAIKKNANSFDFAADSLKNNEEFIEAAIKNNVDVIARLGDLDLINKKFILMALNIYNSPEYLEKKRMLLEKKLASQIKELSIFDSEEANKRYINSYMSSQLGISDPGYDYVEEHKRFIERQLIFCSISPQVRQLLRVNGDRDIAMAFIKLNAWELDILPETLSKNVNFYLECFDELGSASTRDILNVLKSWDPKLYDEVNTVIMTKQLENQNKKPRTLFGKSDKIDFKFK